MPVDMLPVSREAVLAAAHVKAGHPIAYADAFAVAALSLDAVILTGALQCDTAKELVRVEPI